MSIDTLPSGNFRVRVTIKGEKHDKVFSNRKDAEEWEQYLKKNKKRLSLERSYAKNLDILNSLKKKFKYINKNKEEKLIDIMNEIDSMSGRKFERYCMGLFDMSGLFPFCTFKETRATGDYGADIIIETFDGWKYSVQCKRLGESPVRIEAIQEVVASKSFYNTDKCIVITNSRFTQNAIELGLSNEVLMIDRTGLEKMILKMFENQNKYLGENIWDDVYQFING